jgi:hypothetical protein
MAARKKARKKAPARKAKARNKTLLKKRATPRELPNDEAWRELVETAVEKPDPVAQKVSGASASRASKKNRTGKAKK